MATKQITKKTKSTKEARNEGLDKFYTVPIIVDMCIEKLTSLYDWSRWTLVVEPSAGNGSFLLKIPIINKIGLDIAPEHEDIVKQNFFTYKPVNKDKILVLGNPPFGKICSLAIAFFNYAAGWADVIAFIIPRTFRRVSVQNKLDELFHLVLDIDIPMSPCSFNPPMSVKCCFQIWAKEEEKRDIVNLVMIHEHWTFLGYGPMDDKGQPTPPLGADFAVRAYGGKCGEIKRDGLDLLRPKSWHWIKSAIEVDVLVGRFNKLDYSESKNTARQNSIGRGELVRLYSKFMKEN